MAKLVVLADDEARFSPPDSIDEEHSSWRRSGSGNDWRPGLRRDFHFQRHVFRRVQRLTIDGQLAPIFDVPRVEAHAKSAELVGHSSSRRRTQAQWPHGFGLRRSTIPTYDSKFDRMRPTGASIRQAAAHRRVIIAPCAAYMVSDR